MNRNIMLFAAGLVLLLGPSAASAQRWVVNVTPYAWATNIGVDATLSGRQVVDQDISVSDLLDHLSTIFQGRLEARHGAVGVMVDLFDATLSDQVSGVPLPQGRGLADLSSDIGMTILDVAGVYSPKAAHGALSFLAGTRILDERATIDATLNLASGSIVGQSYTTDDWTVDGLIGVRFNQPLSRHWRTQMQADVSTGGTDYTWSVGPTVSYAFGKYGQYGANVGYRRMVIDFKDNGDLDTQMTLSGVVVGLRLSF